MGETHALHDLTTISLFCSFSKLSCEGYIVENCVILLSRSGVLGCICVSLTKFIFVYWVYNLQSPML